jgi:hypothetical protein
MPNINHNSVDPVTRGREAEILIDTPAYKRLLHELRTRAFDLWADAPFGAEGDPSRQQALALKMAAELLDAIPQGWVSEARAVLRLREDA